MQRLLMSPPSTISDLPEIEREDAWPGLWNFAERLQRVLVTLPPSSPVLLTGEWGSGKTTLLRSLEKHLTNGAHGTIWFDAWRYEGEATLLPALMRAVWEATPEHYRRDESRKSLFRVVWNASLLVAMRAGPALAAGALAAVVAPGVGAAVAAVGLAEAVKEFLKSSRPKELAEDAEALANAAAAQTDGVALDATKALWTSFSILVKTAWGHDKPPIVLIDDLDRCTPASAVSLMDALRLLVTSAPELNCRFVVAIDRGIVVHAISNKFQGISDYDGNRYLEKIFPLSFAVPVPDESDVNQLVTYFLGLSNARSAESNDDGHALALTFSTRLFSNPRLMKRCINRYRLIRYFETSTETPSPPFRANVTLASWLAATERWPHLRQLMVRYDEDFWRGVHISLRPQAGTLAPEFAELLRDQGVRAWLQAHMAQGVDAFVSTFDEAERRLRRWGM